MKSDESVLSIDIYGIETWLGKDTTNMQPDIGANDVFTESPCSNSAATEITDIPFWMKIYTEFD